MNYVLDPYFRSTFMERNKVHSWKFVKGVLSSTYMELFELIVFVWKNVAKYVIKVIMLCSTYFHLSILHIKGNRGFGLKGYWHSEVFFNNSFRIPFFFFFFSFPFFLIDPRFSLTGHSHTTTYIEYIWNTCQLKG